MKRGIAHHSVLKRYVMLPLEEKKDSKGLKTLITEQRVALNHLWWGSFLCSASYILLLGHLPGLSSFIQSHSAKCSTTGMSCYRALPVHATNPQCLSQVAPSMAYPHHKKTPRGASDFSVFPAESEDVSTKRDFKVACTVSIYRWGMRSVSGGAVTWPKSHSYVLK